MIASTYDSPYSAAMNRTYRSFAWPALVLLLLALLAWFAPVAPIDPWKILVPKKICTMIFALAFIQVIGSFSSKLLGARAGAILAGFFGGIISSTATTAGLAKKSKSDVKSDAQTELLTFLAATMAMLFEGAALVVTGTDDFHFSVILIFLGPLLATTIMLISLSHKIAGTSDSASGIDFKVMPLLKLSLFILGILSLSKILQHFMGKTGLLVLTFLVSLFEIHGSVIANVQLHDLDAISVRLLIGLLALSVLASYLSKLFLISVLGSKQLRNRALRTSLILFLSLLASWLTAISLA